MAQWILRLPTEQEIPSSNLGMDFGKVQSDRDERYKVIRESSVVER